MKKYTFLVLWIAMACNSSQKSVGVNSTEKIQKIVDPTTYAATITEDDLKEHLYTYASDDFEGRETGTPGQKKAVAYLKTQYQALGIDAAQTNGDYFQKVPLEVGKVPEGNITINGKNFELGEHVLTFSAAEASIDGIEYLGFGIEDEKYSDYEGVDVTGKVVLVKSGEPQEKDGTYVISGSSEPSQWSNASESLGKRSELAFEKGAKGLLYYDTQNYARLKGYFDYAKNDQRGRMGIANEAIDKFIIMLDEEVAMELKSDINEDSTPSKLEVDLTLNVQSANKQIDTENVAAIIKGSEKPDEYLIISSHLDHIGVNDDGQINNGADDDGSGSVALLEIAEAFKKATDEGNGPKRSVVFLHVTGEEKGLLGSRYYTDHDPIFPLEQTVTNLNIDMIGRIDPKRQGDRNYIYLIGSDKLSTELHELSEEINAKYSNIELDYTYNDENDPNRFYYRSDHYNFAKNNIPIIFYFNGTHEDYHRPGDTPDKINYDLLQNRTRLVFHTAWEVANRPEKVLVDKAVE